MPGPSRDLQSRRDPTALIVGAVAAQVIGGLLPQMLPLVVGGLMAGLALSERDAGFVTSVELLVLAVTAIVIAPMLSRYSYRRAGIAAAVLTLIAQGASIFSTSLASLIILRALAGIGEGTLYAVSLAVVAARSNNPDKVYGYFQIAWALGSVPLFAGGGRLTAAYAQHGIFALIAGVALVLTPLLWLIPDDRVAGGGGIVGERAPASPVLGIVTLVAIVLYLMVSAGVYAFSTSLGERAGLGTDAVGYALTAATLFGLVGAGAATALNVRWGRAIPISGFFVVFIVVTVVLCLWRNPIAYVVAIIVSAVIYYFSLPYMFGLAAALDRSGRWAAAAGSAFLLGFGAGPRAGGVVIDAAGYAGLAVASVIVPAVAWALTMAVCRRLGDTAGTALAADPAAGVT